MDIKVMSFAAAALAFGAVALTLARADAGDNIMVRVVALASAGMLLIAYGWRNRDTAR